MFKFPYKMITINGNPYMKRYYLGQIFGRTFYLHKWYSPDLDRQLHNHPFKASFSILLKGHYTEVRSKYLSARHPFGAIVEERKVRWFNFIGADTFHSVKSISKGLITLFSHGGYVKGKGWGFLSTEFIDGKPVLIMNEHSTDNTEGEWWKTAPKEYLWK